MKTTLPATALLPVLRDAIEAEGTFRFTLRGTSMRPTLPSGCTIEAAPLPETFRPGMLVVFAAGDALVSHRLVRECGGFWIAQGDGRPSPDRPLSHDQFAGLVKAAYEGEHRIWPSRWEPLLAHMWILRYHALRPVRVLARRLARSGSRRPERSP